MKKIKKEKLGNYKNNLFIEKLKDEYFNSMKFYFKNKIDDKDLKYYIDKIIKEKIKDKNVILHNNYKNKIFRMKLTDYLNYIYTKKPIICSSGILLKQHKEAINPALNMLEGYLNKRSAEKKLMLEAIANNDTEQVSFHNTRQTVLKLMANSYFGVNGLPVSFFYNQYIAGNITRESQFIISHTLVFFEYFLSNNIIFENESQAIKYIENILSEDYDFELENTFTNKEELYNILSSKIKDDNNEYKYLRKIINRLSTIELSKIYYKNNLYELFKNKLPKKLLTKIFKLDIDFMNPYKVPDEFINILEKLWNIIKTYICYFHSVNRKINFLITRNRKTVITEDTDSNYLNLNKWVKFCCNEFNIDYTINNRVKMINVITYSLSLAIKEVLAKAMINHQIESQEYRDKIAMKNEYIMSRIVLTPNKRNYLYRAISREGAVIPNNGKTEIKGLNFKKANVNEKIEKELTNLVDEFILLPEKIDIIAIINRLLKIEDNIINSFKNGELTYAIPIKVNNPDKYKMPNRMRQIRGSIAYNLIYSDNPIQFPDEVSLIQTTIFKLEDIECLKKDNKDIYNKLKIGIFENDSYSKYGLEYFCFPKSVNKIPEWIIPFINSKLMAKSSLTAFNPIIKSLGLKVLNTKNGKQFYSNIIDI